MGIKYLDMFSGIGGFRSALDRVGGFECVGFCEIDEKAKETYEAIYDTKGELYFNDAREINPNALPDIDLICGGFPCQSFSIAGKRGGFEDTRGTLFLKLPESLPLKNLNICCLKMYPDCLTTTKAGHFKKSSVHWMNWGTMSHGKCITARISEFPNQESDCILSAIIEKKCEAKYLLSLKQLLQILSDAYEEVKVIECTPLMVHQLLSQARQEDLAEKQDFT